MTAPTAARYAARLVGAIVSGGSAGAAGLSAELGALIRGRSIDLDELMRRIMDEVVRRLQADRGTLYLVDRARGELVSRAAHLPELTEIRVRFGEGVAGEVARTGVTRLYPSAGVAFSDRIDGTTGYQTRSLLAAPVVREGVVVGVLQLLNARTGLFTEEDAALLRAIADEVAELLDTTSLASQLGQPERPLSFGFNDLVGDAPAMREVVQRIGRAARTEATVLVRGESGVGKELVARAIHDNSARRDGPFVVVDCAALPEALIENELFGHERGAFTSADRTRTGRVHAAAGGTLFIDEVGELAMSTQGKLLRLLQERTFFRVGSSTAEQADVRFVFATWRDLEEMVRKGVFRQDLYYRLRVVEIRVPPLRERGADDLDRLIDHFLHTGARRHRRPGITLGTAARARLHAHAWPGNVRELQHCIEAAVVLAPTDRVDPADLPLDATPTVTRAGTLYEVEMAYIREVLAACGGNRAQAARILGIGRNTLNRRLPP